GVVNRMQRPLRERRERPDLLDLVPEELDTQRLAAGGRKDVDEPAAHGELAAVLDPIDAPVAGEREPLGQPLDAVLRADRDPNRSRSYSLRRHALGDRGRRYDDEPPGSEHVERAGPLADEVRRRPQSRVPANAAAGQQGDTLGAEVPADGLGEVARV